MRLYLIAALLCLQHSSHILAESYPGLSIEDLEEKEDNHGGYNSKSHAPCPTYPFWTQPVAIELGMHSIPSSFEILLQDIYHTARDYLKLSGLVVWYRVTTSSSPFLSPVRKGFKAAAEIYTHSVTLSKALSVRLGLRDEELDARSICSAFSHVLRTIKHNVLHETGIELTSALIIYPDWFETIVQEYVRDSAYAAGMGVVSLPQVTQRQLFERHQEWLLFDGSQKDTGPESEFGSESRNEKLNLVLLNQGYMHFDLMTSGPGLRDCMGILNVPIDWMGCHALSHGLVHRVTGSSGRKDLRAELKKGGDKARWELGREIMRIRRLFKAQREVDGALDRGQSHGHHQDGEDTTLEEWPLDLDAWWTDPGHKTGGVSLLWDDIEIVDEEYVNSLAGILDSALLYMHGSTPPDGVVILSSFCDGSLLTRAVQRSMGENVRIFGASGPGQDVTYMARLGARVAWGSRENTAKQMEKDCWEQAVKDSVEESRVHDEL
ncbi:hypothetical protein BDV11DRAFT_169510 [Aspergillus similis]